MANRCLQGRSRRRNGLRLHNRECLWYRRTTASAVATISDENRTAELIVSTGAAVERYDFWTSARYVEKLNTPLSSLLRRRGSSSAARASLASNPARWTESIRKAPGLVLTLHDLRRTCATGCARLGASESTVSRILGHEASAGTVAGSSIYDRFDRLPEIRAALTAWADYVEALIRENEKQGDVAEFGRGVCLTAGRRQRPPNQLAFARGCPEIARARSRAEAPRASSDRISRSRETDGSPPSILATRD
jgi:hypothetical protein